MSTLSKTGDLCFTSTLANEGDMKQENHVTMMVLTYRFPDFTKKTNFTEFILGMKAYGLILKMIQMWVSKL